MVLNAMNRLIFQAKLYFSSNETQDRNKETLCDSYLSDIELLQQLQRARVGSRFSLIELTDKNKVRYLRDKLIEEKAYDTALYVCSRYSLDRESVWAGWGIAALQQGDLQTARDKLRHIMMSPKTTRQGIDMILKTVVNALGFLPGERRWSISKSMSEKSPEKKRSFSRPETPQRTSVIVDTRPDEKDPKFQECIYYLEEFGTPMMMAKFLIHWKCYRQVTSS